MFYDYILAQSTYTLIHKPTLPTGLHTESFTYYSSDIRDRLFCLAFQTNSFYNGRIYATNDAVPVIGVSIIAQLNRQFFVLILTVHCNDAVLDRKSILQWVEFCTA